jgi:DNA processing protein
MAKKGSDIQPGNHDIPVDESLALIALSRLKGLKNDRKKWIVDNNETVSALFDGKRPFAAAADRNAFRGFRDFEALDAEVAHLRTIGIQTVTIKDKEYPELLRQIPDPPIVLYKKGHLPISSQAFAIVGARKATFEGMALAERIAETLSSAGIMIVSGLARGVDAAAHKGALGQPGKTVGVLGCGIDICYPAENWTLFQAMAKDGAILTEYPCGERPLKHHFPERNRIIAGLSAGVLVVEASARSGSLITARLALDYGRDVMAIPGRVFDEAYKGANGLIKQGARLVEDIRDIVNCCFPDIEFRTKPAIDMDGDEDYIYRLMGVNKIHVDELIGKSTLETRKVVAILTRLEMKDLVRSVSGGFYMRKT